MKFLTEMPSDLFSMLSYCAEHNVSDIHIKPDENIFVRHQGKMYRTNVMLDKYNLFAFLNSLGITGDAYGRLVDTKTSDFTFELGILRFRVNVISYKDSYAYTIRIIDQEQSTPSQLGFKDDLIDVIRSCTRGMIIFTGTTTSGKSTSINSFIKHVIPEGKNIIMLADPVEAIIDKPESNILQMEYLRDFRSFAEGIATCMRKDPDVICIGEMRDAESIKGGLLAAETGHLVITTCHSQSADNVKSRMLAPFEGSDINLISNLFDCCVNIVVHQQLVRDEIEGKLKLEYDYRLMGEMTCM